jgi:hypothetical protein
MRTVHETEALRPSDPVPKHHNPPIASLGSAGAPANTGKLPRIKLKLTQPPKDEAASGLYADGGGVHDDVGGGPEDAMETTMAGMATNLGLHRLADYSADLAFDEHELSLRPGDLFRLLRRQIHWAETEGANLRREWQFTIEPQRKEAWRSKEAIFDEVMDAEVRLLNLVVKGEGLPLGMTTGVTAATRGKEPGVNDGINQSRTNGLAAADTRVRSHHSIPVPPT